MGPKDALSGRLSCAWFAATGLLLLLQLALASTLVVEVDGVRWWGVSDDIYITACYARSLAEGHGAVWHAGAAPVEGYSNPLWMLLFSVLHALPGFEEPQLGLWVHPLQALFCLLSSWLAWHVLSRLVALAGGLVRPPGPGAVLLVFLLGLSWAALPLWLADGFELGLVAVLALSSLLVVLDGTEEARAHPGGAARCALAGVCAGLCFWTRLDGVFACLPAFGLLVAQGFGLCGRRPWRETLAAPAVLCLFAAALFAVRRAVYGEWLPNTYWLKLAGWPLADRLAMGWGQNAAALAACGAASLLVAWRGRSTLGRAWLPCLALCAATFLMVAYSTHNGGDSWALRAGWDRFGAIGALYLALALVLLAARELAGPSRATGATAVACGCALLALGHLPFDRGTTTLRRQLTGEYQRAEQRFLEWGVAYREASVDGARALIGAAGAIVYVSRRAALDGLGKCDPWVARQPVNLPGKTSGHNKRYMDALYVRERPEFGRHEPPAEVRPLYGRFACRGVELWVRKDAPHARWDRLRPLEP